MASYRKFSLPALKVTRWSAVGPKSTTSVYRRLGNPTVEVLDQHLQPGLELQESLPPLVDMVSDCTEPTEHELSCRSSVAGWEEIRDELRTAVTENAAMPQGQLCVKCAEIACIRCQRCGPFGFFCSECFSNVHSEVNLFHIPEKWEVRLHTYTCRAHFFPVFTQFTFGTL